MKKLIIIVLILLAVAFLLFSRGGNDDEFFTEYFNKMVEAGKSKDIDNFMENFSLQYRDEYGINYIVLKNIVKKVFEENEKIEGSFSGLTSSITKDSDGKEVAVINLDAFATGTKSGIKYDILGNDGIGENITVYLEKSTLGSWNIVEVKGVDSYDY